MKLLFLACSLSVLTACATAPDLPDEPLQDRYWRAIEIDGKALPATAGRAEAHVVLGANQRAHGSDGCNRFHGSYDLSNGLRFGQLATTMMACPPPVDQLARSFAQALGATASYRIRGKEMQLLDQDGKPRLRLEATFLK
nr:META domain-containing protein [Dechloromonas sp.]